MEVVGCGAVDRPDNTEGTTALLTYVSDHIRE
jgi:hypothetical protein